MTLKIALFAMTALAMVSGCSPGGSTSNSASNNAAGVANAAAPANTAQPAAANATGTAAAGGGTVDQAFLVGRWGMNGDCSQIMEFKADGTATPPEGSTYAISGNIVTVTSPGQPPDPKTVTRTGDDAMTVSGGGASMNMTRCH